MNFGYFQGMSLADGKINDIIYIETVK